MQTKIVLRNKEGEALEINGEAWLRHLSLAQQHGWRATGTSEPDDWRDLDYEQETVRKRALDRWLCLPGSYDTPEERPYDTPEDGPFLSDPESVWAGQYDAGQGQEVSAEDARALSEALGMAFDAMGGDYEGRIQDATESYLARFDFLAEETFGEFAPYFRRQFEEHAVGGYYLSAEEFLQLVGFCRKGAFRIS